MEIQLVRAGAMDKRITLMRMIPTTDSFGADVSTYQEYDEVSAQWVPQTARETIQAGKEDYIEQGIVRIRWHPDLKTTDRFRLEGREHRIESIIEIQRRKGHEIVYSVTKER